jgi:hypothetical protein
MIRLRHPRALAELGLCAGGYLTYFGVRAITTGETDTAFDNAAAVMRFERETGLAIEESVQRVVLDHRWVVDAANAVYIYGHWPAILLGGILLYRLRPPRYRLLRNTMLLTGLVGLFIFALFPVAPPRLADPAVVDTVSAHNPGYRVLFPPSLVNEFAAVPSFHVGWDFALGVAIWGATTNIALRAVSVVLPAAQAVAVVLTANHYIVDGMLGVAIVLLALGAQRAVAARRAAHGRSVRNSSIAATTPSAPLTSVMPACIPIEKDTAPAVVAAPCSATATRTCCPPAPPGVRGTSDESPAKTRTAAPSGIEAGRSNAASRQITTPRRQAHAKAWTRTTSRR